MGLKAADLSTQIIQRDRHAHFMSTLAIIASSIDRWATEFRHLQRTEVLEVEEFFGEPLQKLRRQVEAHFGFQILLRAKARPNLTTLLAAAHQGAMEKLNESRNESRAA